MKCWYCGAPLGNKVYEVPGLLGYYCYRCALMLCDEGEEPVLVDIADLDEA